MNGVEKERDAIRDENSNYQKALSEINAVNETVCQMFLKSFVSLSILTILWIVTKVELYYVIAQWAIENANCGIGYYQNFKRTSRTRKWEMSFKTKGSRKCF